MQVVIFVSVEDRQWQDEISIVMFYKSFSPAFQVDLVPTEVDVFVREDRRDLLEELFEEVKDLRLERIHRAEEAVRIVSSEALRQKARLTKFPGLRVPCREERDKLINQSSLNFLTTINCSFMTQK